MAEPVAGPSTAVETELADVVMTESPLLLHPWPVVGKAPERPLNVNDALSYLDAVKAQFKHEPDVYKLFLDIMKDFKGQLIDTLSVIQRVAHLFYAHPLLISGFSAFLPYGYQITIMQDPKVQDANCVRVTTPGGNVTDTTIVRIPSVPLVKYIQPALDYIQRVKTRFADEPERYRKFLDILSTKNDPVLVEKEGDVTFRVYKHFYDAPDLMNGLWEFLGEDPIDFPKMPVPQILERLYSLDTSSPDFSYYLYCLVKTNEEEQDLSSLQGPPLTKLVDFLDSVLDVPQITGDIRRLCLHQLQAICSLHMTLPSVHIIVDGLAEAEDEPLASGGFSDIWEGTYNDTKVCIKRPRVTKQNRSTVQKAFYREAIIWKRLKHPNIVPLIGVTQTPLRFVSKWMPNGTITEYVNKNPKANRIALLLDVAEGLAYLHGMHIAHADLKGPNILIDHEGHARLTDFGFASIVRGLDSVLVTKVQGFTPRWTAPEVIRTGDRNTKEADVFSFGMVGIEVFTGKHPFSEFALILAVSKIIGGEQPSRPQDPDLTNPVWDMILSCWHQEPVHRPTMANVVQVLRECHAVHVQLKQQQQLPKVRRSARLARR